MGARIHPRSHRDALLAILFGAFAASVSITACSSETNQKPPDNNFTTSTGTGTETSTSTSASATGTGGAGGGGTSSATGTGGAPPKCDGPNGCYACPPKTGVQILNACSGSQCSPFDNVARLPLYNNGNLPPIP
jgi:hypothetical protein